MDAVSAATPPKLDVVRVLLAAVVAPIFHWRTLVWFALPVIAADLAGNVLASPAGGAVEQLAGLLGLATMVAMIVLDVACYRVFVLGPQSTAGHSFQWWAHRVARFFGWGMLIVFFCALFAFPAWFYLAGLSDGDPAALEIALGSVRARFVVFVLSLPALYLFCRFALIFPAIATRDAPVDLVRTWQLSAGNGLRLMLVAGIWPGLAEVLIGSLAFAELLAVQTIATVVMPYVAAVQAAAISTAYRELSPLSPPR